MRKYYKIDDNNERYVGSVNGTTVTLVDQGDFALVNTIEKKLDQAFKSLGSNNLNASMAYRLYLGGALLILDMSNISKDVAQFVYHHEIGHIRLGHQATKSPDGTLVNELAADEYSAARVPLFILAATIEWLRSMAETLESNPNISGFDSSSTAVAGQHLRIRAQVLEKRLQA